MNEELTRMIEPEIIKMGVSQRIISLFTAPGELMKNIKAYPVILIPLLLSIVIGLISIAPGARVTELVTQEMSNISIERYGVDHFDLSAFEDEYGDSEIMAAMDAITAVSLGATAVLGPLLMSFLAALGLFILSKIARGQAKFGQMFSMYMHIYVILVLGGLIVSFLMSLTGSVLDMTSLAAVFAPQGNIAMLSYNIFSGISIFTIWVAVLTFIGVKTINDFSSVKAGVITGIAFLTGLAVHVGTYMLTWWLLDIQQAAMGAL